nr:class I SAM-dependent methyltransferase [Kineosporia mesophila]
MRLLNGLVDRVLDPVQDLPSGARVVQIACGTGGLGLALAGRRPDLQITGIDLDASVLEEARAEAAAQGLKIEFLRMDMAGLDLPEAGADAVISRMGLLTPGTGDFGASAREAARILRPGGALSMVTWTDLASSPYTGIGLPLLRRVLPPGTVPDLEKLFEDSARPGALEGYLQDAGLREVEGSWLRWDTEYPDFEAWWQFGAGFGPLKALFGRLGAEGLATARQMMIDDLKQYRTPSGSYRIPARARVITARR